VAGEENAYSPEQTVQCTATLIEEDSRKTGRLGDRLGLMRGGGPGWAPAANHPLGFWQTLRRAEKESQAVEKKTNGPVGWHQERKVGGSPGGRTEGAGKSRKDFVFVQVPIIKTR